MCNVCILFPVLFNIIIFPVTHIINHTVLCNSKVAVTAYVSERCRTANLNLHVCLFTGEEKTYPTQTDTARALRDLARAGNGRFLWLTETGEKRLK